MSHFLYIIDRCAPHQVLFLCPYWAAPPGFIIGATFQTRLYHNKNQLFMNLIQKMVYVICYFFGQCTYFFTLYVVASWAERSWKVQNWSLMSRLLLGLLIIERFRAAVKYVITYLKQN